MATEREGEEAPKRRTPQQQPPKCREDGWKNLRNVRKAAVLRFFWDFVRKLKTRTREGNQAGLYKHLKTMYLEGKRNRTSAYVKDKNGGLLRDNELIRERWVRWIHTLLNAKSPRLDPNTAKCLDQWPEKHAARNSAHDAVADRRHPLVGEPKGCRTGRSLH